jgi:hypothetical protein
MLEEAGDPRRRAELRRLARSRRGPGTPGEVIAFVSKSAALFTPLVRRQSPRPLRGRRFLL